ncbi:MAG: hypothetical protein PVI91_02155 [Gammaproteobacteria bacterium]|jgi:hypothetical protein
MRKAGSESQPDGEDRQAIDAVLQAEREAARAVEACERRAQEILEAARARARRLVKRADQRVTLIQMRCSQRLDAVVRALEQQQEVPDDAPDPGALEEPAIEAVIAALAAELTGVGDAAGEQPDPG